MITKLQPVISTTGIRRILDNEGREIATVSNLLDGVNNSARLEEAEYIHNAICESFNNTTTLRAKNEAQAEVIKKLREALMNSTRFLQETDKHAQFPNHAYSLTVRNIENQIKDNLNTLIELESK